MSSMWLAAAVKFASEDVFSCAALFCDPLINVWCPYYCTVGPVYHHCCSFVSCQPCQSLKKKIKK